MEHVDYDTLNMLREVMEDDFALLLDTFIQDSEDRILMLREMVVGVDADLIRRAAHSFKGSSSNIGALHLMALCANLEKKAMTNNLLQLDQDVQEIEVEFSQVRALLHSLS